jgi:hypothetical protein
MARPSVTVVVQTDPETGDVDPSAPALFYSAEGYFLGSRELAHSEIRLMAGRRTADLPLPPPESDSLPFDALTGLGLSPRQTQGLARGFATGVAARLPARD